MATLSGTLTSPDEQHDHVVSITRIRVRSPRAAWMFLTRLPGVRRQMRATPGLSVYALRAQFLRLTFTTYGVFDDRRALAAFIRADAHGEAMRALAGRLPSIESRTLMRRGADLPHGWRAITALLDEGETRPREGEPVAA